MGCFRERYERLEDVLLNLPKELTAGENEYLFKKLDYHPPRLRIELTDYEAHTLRVLRRLEAHRLFSEHYESIMREIHVHYESLAEKSPSS